MYSDMQDLLEGQRPAADVTPTAASSSGTSIANLIATNDPKKRKAGGGTSTKKVAATPSVFKKPEGMHRELYNLLITEAMDTGVAPIIPTADQSKVGGYASTKAKLGIRKPRQWLMTPFTNPAREDNLQLRHWRRVDQVEAEYPFARFNKVIDVPEYTNQQYESYLAVPNWSKDELDYLFDLCRRFDLRWPVIHDRWAEKSSVKKRSMEDLKERYYAACNALIKARCLPGEQAQLLHFDANHERRRKEQLEKLWNRTEDEVEEEEYLVEELKKIEARRKERERKAQDLQKLITAADRAPSGVGTLVLGGTASDQQTPTISALLGGNAGGGALKKKQGRPSLANLASGAAAGAEVTFTGIKFPDLKGPGPHLRSQSMKLSANIGQKKLKAVEQAIEKMQLEYHPLATEEVSAGFNEFRSNCALLFELKSALASCEFELEATKHQYQAASGGQRTFDIPDRLRVNFVPPMEVAPESGATGTSKTTSDAAGGKPTVTTNSKRTIALAMELSLPPASATRKRKQQLDQSSSLKRLRRS